MRTLAAVVLLVLSAGAQVRSPAGPWTGRIDLPNGPLAIAVVLTDSGSAGWAGAIDIPAQGVSALALADVTVDGGRVAFRLPGVPGNPAFAGALSDDGERLAGTFTQGPASLPFTLDRGAWSRPQEPAPPFPYIVEDVTYRNEAASIGLAGTLTRPNTAAPVPAVLLISGSGPQDRDESLFGHKPFLLLADTLTRRGVAVLRVDDRGVGGSDRGPATATTADLAGDVRAGITFLKARADIDAARIGLLGHSEGGTIASMVAAGADDVAFVVMLAGTGLPGRDVMISQVTALARAQGVPEPLLAWDLAIRTRVYDAVMAETDGQPDAARREALLADLPPVPGTADTGRARTLATTLIDGSSAPWFRFFLTYDPRPALAAVQCPVLALHGDRDVQVVAAANSAAIQQALAEGGNQDATVRILPGLNHLFQTSETGAPGEYPMIAETLAPAALDLVADWIVARTSG